MVVAVAADLVADAVEDQRAVLERLQRLQALLERERRPLLVGPERRGNDAVGAEHDDQPLLPPLLIGEAQAGQVQDEREGRRADAQVADELASVAWVGHVLSPEGNWLKGLSSLDPILKFTVLPQAASKPTSP